MENGFNIDTTFLRPVKAGAQLRIWHRYADMSGKLSIRTFHNITLRTRGQKPGVELTENRFVDDCDFYAELDNSSDCRHIKGRCLYAGYLRNSWGHFLVNSTARLWPLFEKDAKSYDSIVFVAETDATLAPQGNFREFLELAGLYGKCVIISSGSSLHFEDVDIPDIALEAGRYVSDEFLKIFEFVRDKALENAECSDSTQKVLLTRSHWQSKNNVQINVRAIEDFFISNGYEGVKPETLSLRQLIIKMNNAVEVVSFSGSTAHNFLFCATPHLTIVERCGAVNLYQTAIQRLHQRECTLIDAFYQPLLVSSTDNLTIYGLTAQLWQYAKAHGLKINDRLKYTTGKAEKEFRKYLRIYYRHYGHGAGLNTWEDFQYDAIAEAYFASQNRYEILVRRRKPVLLCDYFSPRPMFHWLKSLVKRS